MRLEVDCEYWSFWGGDRKLYTEIEGFYNFHPLDDCRFEHEMADILIEDGFPYKDWWHLFVLAGFYSAYRLCEELDRAT